MPDVPGMFTLKQTFSRTLTINHAQVPSTQTDFPVLVRLSNYSFRHRSHGGHVSNLSGFDIQFYSDSGLTTKLKWEMERYNAGTGEVVAWVKIASVSSVSDTVFYMGYGDPSVVTDQSDRVNTWSNSYSDVYHLNDANLLVDSTNNHDCTQGTVNNVLPGMGVSGGGGAFVTTDTKYLICNDSANNPAALTFSMWAYAFSLPNSNNGVVVRNQTNTSFTGIYVRSDGKLQTLVKATTQLQYNGTGSNTLSLNTWYYLVVTYDSTNGLIGYVNAASDGTVAANGNANLAVTTTIGSANPDTKYWNGAIDEVHLAAVVRSADWITCEYNSQKPTATFVTLGSET